MGNVISPPPPPPPPRPNDALLDGVSFREAVRVWARIGVFSFGGPAGQIAMMHRELVDRRRWVDESRFLQALSYCMLLPGPEATQLAIYIGWLMHRTRGGVVAGVLFVLPGAITMLALSILYVVFENVPLVGAALFGLKAAVLAIVIEALHRIGKRALKTRVSIVIAIASFGALFFLKVPFPIIVIGAGLLGLLANAITQRTNVTDASSSSKEVDDAKDRPGGATMIDRMSERNELDHTRPSASRAMRVFAVCAALWVLPVPICALLFGTHSVFVDEGVFFSKTAVVTFGGAYAVLAYLTQRAVETYGWLAPSQMIDGLGLAETTPGPLILVVQFVAFLGAYHHPPAGVPPIASGIIGSIVTVWVTFVPSFLWILVGGPYIEAFRRSRSVQASLSAITAAIVGVIMNLSVWFATHVLFERADVVSIGPLAMLVPDVHSSHVVAFVIAIGALVALFRFKLALGFILLGSITLAIVWHLARAGVG